MNTVHLVDGGRLHGGDADTDIPHIKDLEVSDTVVKMKDLKENVSTFITKIKTARTNIKIAVDSDIKAVVLVNGKAVDLKNADTDAKVDFKNQFIYYYTD